MKCELCHANDAETVLYRSGKNGRREELYVCQACAGRERAFGRERGVQVAAVEPGGEGGPNPGKPPKGLETLGLPKEVVGQLGEMFGQLSERLGAMGADGETRCPGCGTAAETLRSSGMMGCPLCYKTFRNQVLPLLDDAQQGIVYRGDPFPGREHERELAMLERRQREAVAREDYAEAKRLAEEIRRLRGGGGEEGGHGA